MINSKTYKAITLSLTLGLSGCMGIYEGGFECPPGIGAKCKSISEVNEMVNKGEVPKNKKQISTQSECARCSFSSSEIDPQEPSLLHFQTTEELQIWWAPDTSIQSPVSNVQNLQAIESLNNKKKRGEDKAHVRNSI